MDAGAVDSIADRLRVVMERIRQAALSVGREPDSVRLVAATKAVSVERVREAIGAGLRVAGENRLQEAIPKMQALRDEPIRWHFIGHLQRRKVREVVGRFDLIHSVDTLELASEIDRRAEAAAIRQDVLLEINIGGEPTKTGFPMEQLEERLMYFSGMTHLRVRGLMTIPPPVDDPEQARGHFRILRELAGRLSGQDVPGVAMAELSMGMSSDYVVAVEEGATFVRVGTAIFGRRNV
jgi:pyridoxal phosphate enzyme (YggS family)